MSSTAHKTIRISRGWRWQIYLIGVGVWLSGGLWLLFHYFFVTQGEFGPTENPLTAWWLGLHGAFAFATLWIFGLLWGMHVTAAWPRKRRRRSGAALVAVLAFLVVSGYLLYYVGDDKVRPVISVMHWAMGLAAPAFFAAHRVRLRKRRPVSSLPRV
uniref:DUF4405 domain-containing protein n=1 Tax=Acidobacterium capsulatum TaxID=33075 RepID=A0A7V4XQL4_9BACT